MRVVSSWVVSTVYWQCRVRVVRRTGDWDACRTPSWLLPLPLLRDHALEVYTSKVNGVQQFAACYARTHITQCYLPPARGDFSAFISKKSWHSI